MQPAPQVRSRATLLWFACIAPACAASTTLVPRLTVGARLSLPTHGTGPVRTLLGCGLQWNEGAPSTGRIQVSRRDERSADTLDPAWPCRAAGPCRWEVAARQAALDALSLPELVEWAR